MIFLVLMNVDYTTHGKFLFLVSNYSLCVNVWCIDSAVSLVTMELSEYLWSVVEFHNGMR